MSEFFLPQAGSESPLYAKVRDEPRRADWRRWVQELWRCFEPLAPKGFRDRARGSAQEPHQFAQCLAEMWFGVGLADHLGSRVQHGGDGAPDFRIDVGGGAHCWVEVVAPGPSEGSDRIEPFPESKPGECVTFPYSLEPKLKRVTSQLASKTTKFAEYRERRVVGPRDLAVIAVSEFAFGDHGALESSHEMLCSALEGMAHPVVGFGGKPDVTHSSRSEVRKVDSGAAVSTQGWRAGLLSGIDAVLYSNANLSAASRKSDSSDWCWFAAPSLDRSRFDLLRRALGAFDRLDRRDLGDRLEIRRVPGEPASSEVRALDGLFSDGKIERVLTVTSLADAPTEVEAWARFDGSTRLKALLDMRERYARWIDGAEPRLERILAVTRHT